MLNKLFFKKNKKSLKSELFLKENNSEIFLSDKLITNQGIMSFIGFLFNDAYYFYNSLPFRIAIGDGTTQESRDDTYLYNAIYQNNLPIINSYIDKTTNSLKISIILEYTPSTNRVVRELGVFIKNTLFDRIVFPDVTINANETKYFKYVLTMQF